MSAAAKRGGRFSYLTSATESTDRKEPPQEQREQETDSNTGVGREDSRTKTDTSGGGAGRGRTTKKPRAPTRDELTSVPKGQGRMKQERSQLNVRLPTTLKRQAAAKAVLEGRDIGEVIEELLREYLQR